MYTLLVDGTNVLGDELETSVIDPTATVGLNKAGTAEFTLPPQHPFYNYIEEMKSVVEIHEIDNEGIDDIIFYGRVSGTSRDWFNRKRVTCEGALAFFNDTIQRRKIYNKASHSPNTKKWTVEEFFRDLIARHNSNYPDPEEGEEDIYKWMKFEVPEDGVDIRDPEDPDVEKKNNTKEIYRKTDYQKTIECLQEMCIDAEGGYLFVERDPNEEVTYIYWWSKMKYDDLNQNVQFGLNLLDLNQDFECDELYTALLPLGATYDYYKRIESPDSGANPSEKGWYHKDDEGGYYASSDTSVDPTHIYFLKEERRKNIKEKNGGIDYVQNDDAVAKYGFILQVKEWSDISSPSKLKKKALEWLNSERFDKMTITCNATDLSAVNPDFDKIKIGARVRVVSPQHGITEKIFPISEITYHLDSGKKEVTLGTQERKTLSYITSKGTKEYRMPDAYYDEDVDDDEEEGGE